MQIAYATVTGTDVNIVATEGQAITSARQRNGQQSSKISQINRQERSPHLSRAFSCDAQYLGPARHPTHKITRPRGIRSISATNAINASFARPSTGGVVSEIFTAPA